MGTAEIVLLAIIIVGAIALVLKCTVFKGPRWLREEKKSKEASQGAGAIMSRPAWKVRIDDALHSFEDNVLGLGGEKRDLVFLVISGVSILLSFGAPQVLPFDWAWFAIVLCSLQIVLEALVALPKTSPAGFAPPCSRKGAGRGRRGAGRAYFGAGVSGAAG